MKKATTDEKRLITDSHWISNQNLTQYTGRWVAVYEQKILASNAQLKVVMEQVNKQKISSSLPFYLRVPEGPVVI